ncbi:MAG: glutamate--tRNA ligase [bacterium]
MTKTRFAPSPTGFLHLGGARTALYSWLYARKHQGKFVLRIEDTDKARSTQAATDAILQSLKWLGLDWDEGPYFQSGRSGLYQELTDRLLREGKAYRCYCSPEELEQKRKAAMATGKKPKYDGKCREAGLTESVEPHVVRFRSPLEGETAFEDRIKGAVVFQNRELDDLIIRRSDGSPTYNFVVVADDASMGITDIIRGDDHLNNTPRQILLYQALGYEIPSFAHLPLILGRDKSRLSKRHGATSVGAYQEAGYLPEALINFLARIGWSYQDQEIFSLPELIEKFDLGRVGKSAGVFNQDKLNWLNAHYLKELSPAIIAGYLIPFLKKKGVTGTCLERIVISLRERSKTLAEMGESALFYFDSDLPYREKDADKFLIPESKEMFEAFQAAFSGLDNWNEDSLKTVLTMIMEKYGLKMKQVAQPLRVALTFSAVSPGIYEVMTILGKEEVLKRMRRAIRRIALGPLERIHN